VRLSALDDALGFAGFCWFLDDFISRRKWIDVIQIFARSCHDYFCLGSIVRLRLTFLNECFARYRYATAGATDRIDTVRDLELRFRQVLDFLAHN
jgi:hypothetical protein